MDARFYRKAFGQKSRLAYFGHALMENRNRMAVTTQVTHAIGTAERDAALKMGHALPAGVTLGADVVGRKTRRIVPHVAINGSGSKSSKRRTPALPDDIAASDGHATRLRCRKRIEEIFSWGKTTGRRQPVKVQRIRKVVTVFTLAPAAYNSVHHCWPWGKSVSSVRNIGRK